MLRLIMKFAAAVACLASLGSAPATAADGALVGLHSLVRSGNKVCMATHDHFGRGSGSTKRAARRDMIAGWSSFTALEYGNAWGRFSRAADRAVKCSQSTRRSWVCTVTARPCRYALRTDARPAKKRLHRRVVRRKVRQVRRRIYRRRR